MLYIAVIDDRATNREVLATLATTVAEEGRVEAFSAPQAALDSFAQGGVPDLIITDFNMPGMDGASFIRRFRVTEGGEDIPIIVVSAYEDRRYRYEALEAGATDFLRSPIDHYEFKTRARNLLTLRRQQLILRERAEHLEDQLSDEAAKRRKEMRESRRRLAAVIDSVPALVYAVDDEHNLIFANKAASDFFKAGQGDREQLARAIERAWSGAESAGDKTAEAYGGVRSSEETLYADDGQKFTFLTNKTLLTDPENRKNAVIVISTDITDRSLMEQELRDAKARAEAANEAKSQFLMNMSHELRTPLNVIIGFSDFMYSEPFGPLGDNRYKDHSGEIANSGRHLLHLINEILELSRIDQKQVELSESEFDLKSVIDRAIKKHEDAVAAKHLDIAIDLSGSSSALFADADKLCRAMENLFANAVKFSNDNGRIAIVTSMSDDGGVRLTLTDEGIGMSDEEIDVAVRRFDQVFDNARTKKYQGAGLGLPVAIGLVESHGGSVRIESQKGQGTKVTLAFPPERTRGAQDAAPSTARNA